ncbi:MAG TPA: transcriptional repressor LexA [Candidatus Hydrogenedentes bacterium]|nr:transcriptional repressor LexA [Candidatus Hydrogenedentota bacterium]
MAKGLTKRQETILRFIIESIRDVGYPPTIAEIGQEFGISSTNGVNDHLLALDKKGYIERSSKARGIHVTPKAAAGLYQHESAMVPLVGEVAAGNPILAEENIESYVAVSSEMANTGSYCLRICGDSMIEDGILDGDVVVVDQTRLPKNGEVVVALVDGDATVKHFFPKGDQVELHPANSSMEPINVSIHDLHIQGVVVGLQRSF